MKKTLFALTAAILLAPATLLAQQTTTRTWFEGERITGVAAASGFQVTLVNSDRTRAVVEVDRDLERYVRVEIDGGVVSVGIRSLNNRERREFDRLFNSRRSITKKMTLYLPTLNTIRLSSSSSLTTSDSFPGRDLDILTSGSGAIHGELRVSSERVKLQCSSASRVENLILGSTRDLTAVLSGSSRATIVATSTVYSRLSLSSAASLQIAGNGYEGTWTTSGSSRIVAEEFTVKKLTVTTSSGSSVRANVEADGEQLVARLSGSSNVSITARGVGMSSFSLTSGSSLRITGNGDRGDWTTSGSARIVAEEFALRDLSVTASSGSSARVNVSGTLTTQTSGSAAVRYAGNPARINDMSSGVRPL